MCFSAVDSHWPSSVGVSSACHTARRSKRALTDCVIQAQTANFTGLQMHAARHAAGAARAHRAAYCPRSVRVCGSAHRPDRRLAGSGCSGSSSAGSSAIVEARRFFGGTLASPTCEELNATRLKATQRNTTQRNAKQATQRNTTHCNLTEATRACVQHTQLTSSDARHHAYRLSFGSIRV